MNLPFEQYLRSQMQLGETEIASIYSRAKVRRLRRNEPFLAAGEVCKSKIFVQSGLLKVYTLSQAGNETIFYFLQQHSWSSLDIESYDKQSPSSFHVSAIEPAELLIWKKQDFSGLLAELPELKNNADKLGVQKYYIGQHRLMAALMGTPEEKYEQFKQDYPGLLQKLPLHMVAAYLGVSVKTITRIRQAQSLR